MGCCDLGPHVGGGRERLGKGWETPGRPARAHESRPPASRWRRARGRGCVARPARSPGSGGWRGGCPARRRPACTGRTSRRRGAGCGRHSSWGQAGTDPRSPRGTGRARAAWGRVWLLGSPVPPQSSPRSPSSSRKPSQTICPGGSRSAPVLRCTRGGQPRLPLHSRHMATGPLFLLRRRGWWENRAPSQGQGRHVRLRPHHTPLPPALRIPRSHPSPQPPCPSPPPHPMAPAAQRAGDGGDPSTFTEIRLCPLKAWP